MALVVDVAVVGGGLGGLAVATLAARRGERVCLLERAGVCGGRGASHVKDGFTFNLGGHALYRAGHAERVLAELGVSYRGAEPAVSGGFALHSGRLHALPSGALSLLRTGLLSARGKVDAGRLLAKLASADTKTLASTSLRAWLTREASDPIARSLFEAFIRVSTYSNAPDLLSAGSALAQLRHVQKHNVLYLHGGWQTLVDGLRERAEAADVRIELGADVRRVETGETGLTLRQVDGQEIHARAAVLAVPPSVAAALTTGAPRTALEGFAAASIPTRAACLDVALSKLPRPDLRFALGIDAPLYFSVHSSVCTLGPEGGALIHTMKYLPPPSSEESGADPEAELEALLDRVQPGWRDAVLVRRYLPSMVSSNALATASGGGLTGRAGPRVPGADGLFVVGDWVGQEGMLLDAALASASRVDALLREDRRAAAVGT
jgi:phytoene dehydrogenase-like protein